MARIWKGNANSKNSGKKVRLPTGIFETRRKSWFERRIKEPFLDHWHLIYSLESLAGKKRIGPRNVRRLLEFSKLEQNRAHLLEVYGTFVIGGIFEIKVWPGPVEFKYKVGSDGWATTLKKLKKKRIQKQSHKNQKIS